ncbi:MAG TPA: uracil phosphoribosyltransferase [Verrucomicrobia bacterium]|nr:MAG: uracil phosphoribosyltransferase [Lentisphaerae bacterium GWF2_57_35]HBA82538.1 uracil phosphoribosyltransferase [Verrucomicrobiota bacterium]
MKNVYVIDHPLVQHHLVSLRDRKTTSGGFRRMIQRLSILLTYEAAKDLEVQSVKVRTPLALAKGKTLKKRIGLIPILRAGLGMVDGVLNLISGAEVWHLGFYRDEKTLKPVEYYKKLPPEDPVDVALILDPMLATGGSAIAAIEAMKRWGVKRIKLLCMIAAPEGLKKVLSRYPDTQIYVCAVDDRLNKNGYIVPGLGDAGDRIFNARAP